MRLSDFILGDKIYVPISTLHRLNIELHSISYIESSETSNQPSENRIGELLGDCTVETLGNALQDIFSSIVSQPDMYKAFL